MPRSAGRLFCQLGFGGMVVAQKSYEHTWSESAIIAKTVAIALAPFLLRNAS